MLEDLTIGVILAVKHGYKNEFNKEAIKKFLSDYTLTPIQYYLDKDITRIVITCFKDYIGNHKAPRWVMEEFFMNKYGIHNMDDTDSIISCFKTAQVRDCYDTLNKNYEYVNGFHDFEFNELKLTINS